MFETSKGDKKNIVISRLEICAANVLHIRYIIMPVLSVTLTGTMVLFVAKHNS